ncbi:uncharacterized protein EAE98_007027 [Botrytis deweyae]|uniref:Tautomerase cis-CaaD-like domain-containing protein n=1 Tax=Botrytis deweyae TaxID=2478750 RepID=A0ABQ7II58_9HELO|nr:uncharacterized protein EAE98_007027 [Botrytis deweyae]KAF7924939.1 hypothetical protein EAE98_007027 [Botrytis deweyae]
MPFWNIYYTKNAFDDENSKKSLSQDITKLYTEVGLPAFYVVVVFTEVSDVNMYVGGDQPTTPFIRIAVDHIAVHMEEAQHYEWTSRVDEALKPHIEDKGYNWEYHIDETERRLWKVNGMYAPPFGSQAEKAWVAENKPLRWEETE